MMHVVNAHMPVLIEKLLDAVNQRRIATVIVTRVCNQLNSALAINLNQQVSNSLLPSQIKTIE